MTEKDPVAVLAKPVTRLEFYIVLGLVLAGQALDPTTVVQLAWP